MTTRQTHVVTGAYGYTGKYIARRLLALGHEVRTVTNSTKRANEFGGRVKADPLCFDDPDRLTASLEGIHTLYNTYWVRFDHALFTHQAAVDGVRVLFRAAHEAGVKRVVHVSVTKPSEDSHLPYFRGKAQLERALLESGLSYAILRPTVVFGQEDILVNNIAWMLRKFPVFAMFGDGSYRLQPIYVDDLARLAVEMGESTDDVVIDAIGPETFTFRELIETVGEAIGKRRPMLGMPPFLAQWVGSCIGKPWGDVTITREEVEGLMAELLYVTSEPQGTTRLSEWARANGDTLGRRYGNELARRIHRDLAYDQL